mgnify:CR=1 FL=1
MSFWSSFKQLFGGVSSEDDFASHQVGPAVNPTSGLPMNPDGMFDVAGNPFGTSASDDSFEIGGGGMDFTDNGMSGGDDLF